MPVTPTQRSRRVGPAGQSVQSDASRALKNGAVSLPAKVIGDCIHDEHSIQPWPGAGFGDP